MNIDKDYTLKNINNLYLKSGYFQKYASDVFTTILLFFIFFVIYIYFTSKNELKKVKYKWNQERCNPKYMPFAGYIMDPKDKSHVEYTFENFFYCTDSLLNKISIKHLIPLEFIGNILNVLLDTLIVIIGLTYNFIMNLSFNFDINYNGLNNFRLGIVDKFYELVLSTSEIFKGLKAFILTIFYIFLGMVQFLYSIVQAMYDKLVVFLIGLSIMIYSLLIVFPISLPLLLTVLIPLAMLADKLKLLLNKKEGFKEGKKNKKKKKNKGISFKKIGKKVSKTTDNVTKKIAKATGINKLIKLIDDIKEKIKETQKAEGKAKSASEGFTEKNARKVAKDQAKALSKIITDLFKELTSLTKKL